MRTRIPDFVATKSTAEGNGRCPSHEAICARFFSKGIGARRSSQISHPSEQRGHDGGCTPLRYSSSVLGSLKEYAHFEHIRLSFISIFYIRMKLVAPRLFQNSSHAGGMVTVTGNSAPRPPDGAARNTCGGSWDTRFAFEAASLSGTPIDRKNN